MIIRFKKYSTDKERDGVDEQINESQYQEDTYSQCDERPIHDPCLLSGVFVSRPCRGVYIGRSGEKLYRKVPRKSRLIGGDESAQCKNNKITFPGCPALCAGSINSAVRIGVQPQSR